MIDAKNIITLGPPQTPIHDISVTNVVYAAQGGYELRYRTVKMVMYVREGQHYPWETETVVVGKRYSFKERSIPGLDFYRPEGEHGNTKQGRCECGNSSCHHLGLWEGTKHEIIGNDRFRELLAKRLEYLVKVQDRAIVAKEKRLAKIAADPAAWEAKKIELKAKRDAKKAELAVSQKRADLVKLASQIHAGHWPNGIAPQNPPATIGKQ